MSRNGSGTYSLPAGNPVTSGAAISSSTHNSTMSDIAAEITRSLASDGQTTPSADLPMGAYKHTNVANASARNQYAAAGQVQDNSLAWAGTAGGTADAITLTLTPSIAAYAAGQSFTYKSGASANTTSMTVNVNSVGAKAIQKNGSALAAGDHPANSWFRITYDGAAFQLEQLAPKSDEVAAALALKAPLAGPTLTGTTTAATLAVTGNGTIGGTLGVTGVATFTAAPIAPTAAASTNTTAIATTAYVIAQNIIINSSVATTSGTSVQLSGAVPPWVKRITLLFNGVSTNGTSPLLVQIGYSGGYETSGYGSESLAVESTTPSISTSTAGFVINSVSASDLVTGRMALESFGASQTTWVSSHSMRGSTTRIITGAGSKALTGALDRITITTVAGTAAFDNGAITLLYE